MQIFALHNDNFEDLMQKNVMPYLLFITYREKL